MGTIPPLTLLRSSIDGNVTGQDDGYIDEAEWKKYFTNTLRLKEGSPEYARMMLAFERMDGADNKVSLAEWNQRAHKYVTSGNNNFGELEKNGKGKPTWDPEIIDTNNDGFISDGEFREYLNFHGITGKDAEKAWDIFEENHHNRRGMNANAFDDTVQSNLKASFAKPSTPSQNGIPADVQQFRSKLSGDALNDFDRMINIRRNANNGEWPPTAQLEAMANMANRLNNGKGVNLADGEFKALMAQLPDSVKKPLVQALSIMGGSDGVLSPDDIDVAMTLADKMADGTLTREEIIEITNQLPDKANQGLTKKAFVTATNLLADKDGNVNTDDLEPKLLTQVSNILNKGIVTQQDIVNLANLLPKNQKSLTAKIFKLMGGKDGNMNIGEFMAGAAMVKAAADGQLTPDEVSKIEWPAGAEFSKASLVAVLKAMNFNQRNLADVGPTFMQAIGAAAVQYDKIASDTEYQGPARARFLQTLKLGFADAAANNRTLTPAEVAGLASFASQIESALHGGSLSTATINNAIESLPVKLRELVSDLVPKLDSDGQLGAHEVEILLLMAELSIDGGLNASDKAKILEKVNTFKKQGLQFEPGLDNFLSKN